MGPTAIISLLTYQTVSHLDFPVQHAILLCFMAGIVELIMGIFGLGKTILTVSMNCIDLSQYRSCDVFKR